MFKIKISERKTFIMNSRERLMAVFKGECPGRIPWAPLVDGYFTSSLKEQGMEEMNVVDTLRYIGADILERHVPTVKYLHDSSVRFKTYHDNDREVQIIETPAGIISEEYKTSGKTTFKVKNLLEKSDDLKAYRYFIDSAYYEPDYENFIKEQQYIGDDGLATASGPLTPIQRLLQSDMGIENFTYAMADYRTEMEELMGAMHRSNLECYRVMAKSPAEVVFVYEDTSTTVMSPNWFRLYCTNYLNQYSDIIHKEGKVYICHMCGKLKGMKDEVAKLTADGFDSICPPSTGDTWAHEAFEMWPGKVIIGGIEPPALRWMDVEQTKKYISDVLSRIKPGSRFILSTGDAVSFGTPIENLKAVSELIKEFGQYK